MLTRRVMFLSSLRTAAPFCGSVPPCSSCRPFRPFPGKEGEPVGSRAGQKVFAVKTEPLHPHARPTALRCVQNGAVVDPLSVSVNPRVMGRRPPAGAQICRAGPVDPVCAAARRGHAPRAACGDRTRAVRGGEGQATAADARRRGRRRGKACAQFGRSATPWGAPAAARAPAPGRSGCRRVWPARSRARSGEGCS